MHKKRLLLSVLLTIILLSLSCLPARAGVAIDVDIRDMRPERPLQYRTQLMIEGVRLKIDTTQLRPGEGKSEVIYDSSQRVLYFVQHSEQRYFEVDEVLLFDTIDGVNAALAFLKRKAGVADLPDQSDFYRIRATDEIRHIAALRSRKYIVVRDRGVRQEVWVTSWKEAGIGRETLEAVRRLAAAYDKVMSNLGRVPLFREVEYVPTKGLFEIDGFPVAIQHFENGGLRYDVHLRPLVEAPPDPAAFLVPEGYERAWALD